MSGYYPDGAEYDNRAPYNYEEYTYYYEVTVKVYDEDCNEHMEQQNVSFTTYDEIDDISSSQLTMLLDKALDTSQYYDYEILDYDPV